jgi:hypothetical protein
MQDPYRPNAPGPDPELARLAAQGQQRRAQIAERSQVEQRNDGSYNARVAIGAYRGSTLKRIILATLIGGCVSGVLGIVLVATDNAEIGGPFCGGFGVAFVCIFLMAFLAPRASNGAMAAEQAWLRALPFQVFGYFELLAAEPRYSRSLVYEITWQGSAPPPDPGLLGSVFNAVDPQARLDRSDYSGAQITSGAVSGSTGITVNNNAVYRNHRIPGQVHAVVDQVLRTLHHSCPIARVTVRSNH